MTKNFFNLLLLLIVTVSCQNSAGIRMPANNGTQGENANVHPFLKEGVYKAEYYPSKEVTSKHKQLLQKFSKVIENDTRMQEYFRQIVEEGKKPAYHSNIGISKQEFNYLIELFTDKAPEKFIGTLTILREGNSFSFRGSERLSLLDSLTININNKSASFKIYNMSQVKDSIDLSTEDIPKGDTLEAYEFYSGPDGILGLVTGLNGVYELLIGKLMPSGRTYLSFFARQPDNIEHPIPDYLTVILER